MSKGKAVGLAGCTVGLTVLFWLIRLEALFWLFLIVAWVFNALAFAKYERDWQIIRKAERERLGYQEPMPTISSKGSGRVFKPAPLEDRTSEDDVPARPTTDEIL